VFGVPSGVTHPPILPAPLYQGSVNTWECDDGGHLNIRFHFERAMIGLAYMAHALGMPRANAAAAGATIAPLEAHVRFLKEARPPVPLIMHGGVIALGEAEATLCLDMRHEDGAPSSVFTFRVAHADARSLRPFPWTARTRAAASALTCPLPEHAKPRSFDLTKPPADANRAKALQIGATRIGATMIFPSDCDAFGRMRGEHIAGRASDSVTNLLSAWRRDIANGKPPAGAVVEARIVFRRWPRAGDLMELYSGFVGIEKKTMRLAHWFCDPDTGAAWASMEVVALTFDIDTRKAIEPSESVRAAMQKLAIPISA